MTFIIVKTAHIDNSFFKPDGYLWLQNDTNVAPSRGVSYQLN